MAMVSAMAICALCVHAHASAAVLEQQRALVGQVVAIDWQECELTFVLSHDAGEVPPLTGARAYVMANDANTECCVALVKVIGVVDDGAPDKAYVAEIRRYVPGLGKACSIRVEPRESSPAPDSNGGRVEEETTEPGGGWEPGQVDLDNTGGVPAPATASVSLESDGECTIVIEELDSRNDPVPDTEARLEPFPSSTVELMPGKTYRATIRNEPRWKPRTVYFEVTDEGQIRDSAGVPSDKLKCICDEQRVSVLLLSDGLCDVSVYDKLSPEELALEGLPSRKPLTTEEKPPRQVGKGIYLDPGEYTVIATRQGYERAHDTLVVPLDPKEWPKSVSLACSKPKSQPRPPEPPAPPPRYSVWVKPEDGKSMRVSVYGPDGGLVWDNVFVGPNGLQSPGLLEGTYKFAVEGDDVYYAADTRSELITGNRGQDKAISLSRGREKPWPQVTVTVPSGFTAYYREASESERNRVTSGTCLTPQPDVEYFFQVERRGYYSKSITRKFRRGQVTTLTLEGGNRKEKKTIGDTPPS
jgi:hypothetical protein